MILTSNLVNNLGYNGRPSLSDSFISSIGLLRASARIESRSSRRTRIWCQMSKVMSYILLDSMYPAVSVGS